MQQKHRVIVKGCKILFEFSLPYRYSWLVGKFHWDYWHTNSDIKWWDQISKSKVLERGHAFKWKPILYFALKVMHVKVVFVITNVSRQFSLVWLSGFNFVGKRHWCGINIWGPLIIVSCNHQKVKGLPWISKQLGHCQIFRLLKARERFFLVLRGNSCWYCGLKVF